MLRYWCNDCKIVMVYTLKVKTKRYSFWCWNWNKPGEMGQCPGWWCHSSLCMMTSSNGNNFRVTGPLCGEFTGPGEFPTQRPVTRSFDVFFDLRLNKRLSKQPWGWWIASWWWWHRGHYDVNVMCLLVITSNIINKAVWLTFSWAFPLHMPKQCCEMLNENIFCFLK